VLVIRNAVLAGQVLGRNVCGCDVQFDETVPNHHIDWDSHVGVELHGGLNRDRPRLEVVQQHSGLPLVNPHDADSALLIGHPQLGQPVEHLEVDAEYRVGLDPVGGV